MEIAVITQKDAEGHVKTIRCTTFLTPELQAQAEALNKRLGKRIPAIEKELVNMELLEKNIPKNESTQGRGDVLLWHTLGKKLRVLCEEEGIVGRRERRWLWEAIENIYATKRIKRAGRGRTRVHFEYCFRLARFRIEFAEQVNWSEWVTFFDSRTVREELRIDDWLETLVEDGKKINRQLFRKFVERLNKRVKNLDTSELNNQELFKIYKATWNETKLALQLMQTES